ncbi:MAG TPA: 1-acyl-sn-glycerol-3-phosphate acyltransferase [Candidatus Borkfalkia faecigallinarum]|uniref:1-acyl-sn-glycerol-3-phosphate acyltransferase n=1 Tax=Candidatus Borkfalkia faecigallinarum TaxID=2838509 RepID=A0A9D1VT55_9FIRM|nr:1-acyl-sn-glycerol-3-phosphate acyltransferase [Candidatus Borkfalkia faecigallinarum]
MLTYGFLKKFMVAVTQILFPFKLVGAEKVEDGACVLVGNHYRIWDIVHMACTTKEKVHFITKKELYKNKFLAHLCGIVEAIPVSRDGQDAKAVMTALRYLKNGEKISMFPEGTRNRTEEELLPLKGGAAMFAIKARVPVYPVMCPHKTRLFRRTKILVGDPIDLSAFYERRLTAEDYAAAEEVIREKMLETKRAAVEAFGKKKKKRQ